MIERRGFLGSLAAGLGLVALAAPALRGRLVLVRIVESKKWPYGIMPLHANTGEPVFGIRASDEQVAAVRALRIGSECSVEALVRDPDGEIIIRRRHSTLRLGQRTWDAEPVTEWLRLRRVA